MKWLEKWLGLIFVALLGTIFVIAFLGSAFSTPDETSRLTAPGVFESHGYSVTVEALEEARGVLEVTIEWSDD